jgi:hypothetical protein
MSRKGRRAKSKKRPSVAPKAGLGEVLSVEASGEEEREEPPVSSEPPPADGASAAPSPHENVEPPEQVANPAPVATADERTPGALTITQPSESEGSKASGEESPPSAELDHHFFAARPLRGELPPEPERTDPRLLHRHSAFAMERRKHFAKYVKIAVGVAAAVCLAAVAKVMLVHNAPGTEARAEERRAPVAVAASESPPPAPAVTEAPSAAPTLAVVQSAQPSPAPQASQEPVAAESASAAAVASAPSATTEPAPSAAASASEETPQPDPKEAAKAKNVTRTALERGRFAAAIAAGERSVTLDPTDAEAWLLLGAAYQEKGDMKNARRCYKSCLDEGKRGNKGECAAMLR